MYTCILKYANILLLVTYSALLCQGIMTAVSTSARRVQIEHCHWLLFSSFTNQLETKSNRKFIIERLSAIMLKN